MKGLSTTAHKLHGACCFCGVPTLQAQVTRLETHASKAKHINELETVFAQLIQSIDEVLDEFDNIYQASSPSFDE